MVSCVAPWAWSIPGRFLSSLPSLLSVVALALARKYRPKRFSAVAVQTHVSNTLRGAVVGWAKTLASEVARDGVTVNTLLPGAFETDRVLQVQRATSAQQGITLEEFAQRAARTIPVGRMGKPSEFGAMAAFLASPLAGYITGSMIRLDGGSIRSV